MVVVVLPKKADITGAQPKYQVGDIVNVTCISHRQTFNHFCGYLLSYLKEESSLNYEAHTEFKPDTCKLFSFDRGFIH